MRPSKIEALIRDRGWKGACARSLGMLLVYLGFLYLPAVVDWTSIHLGIVGMSEAQVRKNEAITYVVKIVVVLVIALEGMRMLLLVWKAWRQ
jgi:hypothetical protein